MWKVSNTLIPYFTSMMGSSDIVAIILYGYCKRWPDFEKVDLNFVFFHVMTLFGRCVASYHVTISQNVSIALPSKIESADNSMSFHHSLLVKEELR